MLSSNCGFPSVAAAKFALSQLMANAEAALSIVRLKFIAPHMNMAASVGGPPLANSSIRKSNINREHNGL